MKSLNKQQRGFSLFMVMVIMLVIALLVVVTSQFASTEMRISTNEADRKYAMSLAENGLRTAENEISQIGDNVEAGRAVTFSADCSAGLCMPAEEIKVNASSLYKSSGSQPTVVAWKRTFNNQSVFDAPNKFKRGNNDKIRYIIEYLGERYEPSKATAGHYFRVTVRAQGQNPNTTVILQSYVEMF